MKKILIFTASTGGGHNQAANTLEQYFTLNNYEVVKVDALKETSKLLNQVIVDGYKILVNRIPKAYGRLYKISDKIMTNYRITNIFLKVILNRIYYHIQNNNPDLIIGTHPFIVDLVGKLKKNRMIDIPFISIVTDFHAHQAYFHNNVDAYVTGSYHTKREMIEKGIPAYKIFSYGIPVRREFLVKSNKHKKDKEVFTILLMGGSIGLKATGKVFNQLLMNKNKIKIIAVCGNNKTLKKSIEEKYLSKYKDKEIKVYGFTKNIHKFMEISDVIVTKPGGLTTTESIHKNIPMIIPFVIPGQEEKNAQFLVNNNMAIRVKDINNINSVIDYVISNKLVLEDMKNNMNKFSSEYSIEDIIKLSNSLIDKYNYKLKRA